MEAPQPRLVENLRGDVQGLHVVVVVRRLAAHVEAQPLDDQTRLVGRDDQIDGLAGVGPEFGRKLDHRPRVGHLDPQHQSCLGRVAADLVDFIDVVVSHQRLVLVQVLQRLLVLDRIGVDDLVPDVILPLFFRQRPDKLVDDIELRQGGHVEAAAGLVERLDDRRVGVRLHGIIRLHAGEAFLKPRVVLPQHVVIDDEQRRAVLFGEILQQARSTMYLSNSVYSRKFLNCQGSRGVRTRRGPSPKKSVASFRGVQSERIETFCPR